MEITLTAAESHDFRVGLRIGNVGDEDELPRDDADRSGRFCAQELEFDWNRREQEHLAVENPTDEELVRAVRILNPPDSRYYMVVRNERRKYSGVDGGQVVRDVPDFEASKPMPMCGPDGVAVLVPRDYNHPPLDSLKIRRAYTISYEPPLQMSVSFVE